jgi:hypothetical protein
MTRSLNKKLYKVLRFLENWEKKQGFKKINGLISELTKDNDEYYYLLGKKSLLDTIYLMIKDELKTK